MKNYCLILIFLLLGCQNRREYEFKKYWEKLPVLRTPVLMKSGMIDSTYEIERRKDSILFNELIKLDTNFREKYFPSRGFNSLYGRIYENQEFISIIYRCDADDTWPVLYTFSREGDKIDSLALNKNVGIDVLGTETSTTLLDEEMNIVMKNEATYLNPTTDFNVDFKEIRFGRYLLNNKGHFIKVEEKIDTIK